MIKNLWNFLNKIIRSTQLGFYYICLVFSKGFFFYFFALFYILEKIFKLKIFTQTKDFFYKRQDDPMSFLVLVMLFFAFTFSYTYFFIDNSNIVYVDESILNTEPVISDLDSNDKNENIDTNQSGNQNVNQKELNLFRKYSLMKIENINFDELRNTNSDVVAWLMVDGTNVNYPIVKTSDNDFYLNHNINKNRSSGGWTFMDYRNSEEMIDSNTIFYGHNLINKTSFGSLTKIFTESWFNDSNHYIVVLTDSGRYVYEIFSIYTIDPETYYLKTNFRSSNDFLEFVNKLRDRSEFKFNVDLDENSKIITLSTCTTDNKNRRVVHAKLIN